MWRDFRNTSTPLPATYKNLWWFFETCLVSTKAQRGKMWTELTWIFCKRRKFETQLKKNLEINHPFFSHIFLHILIMWPFSENCIEMWTITRTLLIFPASCSFSVPHDGLPWSPWREARAHHSLGTCRLPPWMLPWPHRHTGFLSLWLLSPEDTSADRAALSSHPLYKCTLEILSTFWCWFALLLDASYFPLYTWYLKCKLCLWIHPSNKHSLTT